MAEKQTNKDRMREIVDSIENGIKELFESDKYQQYLSTMSRFHRYSVNNTMLIYMQRPDATHVAGFNKWRDQFGRNVLKGEKGIRIIAPTPYKKKVEEIKTDPETNAPVLDADGKAIIEEKEIRIPMFKVVSVFDVSQTSGKPLPQLAADLSGNVQQYEVFMEALRRASPVPMEIKPVARDTDGFFSIKAQSITIRAGMSEVQTVCAAVHEIAHAKLHDYEHMTELADDGETILVPGEKSRNTEEVEAESIGSYAAGDGSFRDLSEGTWRTHDHPHGVHWPLPFVEPSIPYFSTKEHFYIREPDRFTAYRTPICKKPHARHLDGANMGLDISLTYPLFYFTALSNLSSFRFLSMIGTSISANTATSSTGKPIQW